MDDEARRNRREAAARTLRRRRRVAALIALSVLGLAVVAVVTLASSSGGTPSSTRQSASATQGKARVRASSHTLRAATREPSSGTVDGPPNGPTGDRTDPRTHVSRDRCPPRRELPFRASTSMPAELTAQMQALKDAGWHAVTLDQVEAYWSRGVPLGARSADRGQLRQRLPVPVLSGPADPAPAGVGRR